jgi:hypothetical protein
MTTQYDELSPREAAVRAWFELRDHTYAVSRLRACVNPSPATEDVLFGFNTANAYAMNAGFWRLRQELRDEANEA